MVAASRAAVLAAARTGPECGPTESVSVIVPVRNAEATLGATLDALAELPPGWELVVVDDHSTDATRAVAAARGVTVVSSAGRRSAAAARNTGIRETRGSVVVFLDADVVVSPRVLAPAARRLAAGGPDALFGVYDRGDHLPGLVARYKNYWIRHSTLHAGGPLDWMNTSVAVVRRESLERAGFFDHALTLAEGEDLDLGRRLAAAGCVIAADPRLEIAHLKRFDLGRLVVNDFGRSRGWFRTALAKHGLLGALRRWSWANVDRSFCSGVVIAGTAVLLLAGSAAVPALLPGAAAALALHPLVNARFLLAARRDRMRGAALFPLLLFVDQLACAAGLGAELASRALPRRPRPALAAGASRVAARGPAAVTAVRARRRPR